MKGRKKSPVQETLTSTPQETLTSTESSGKSLKREVLSKEQQQSSAVVPPSPFLKTEFKTIPNEDGEAQYNDVLASLNNSGIEDGKARELMAKHGWQKVSGMVDLVASGNFRNPAGAIIKGLEESWSVPAKAEAERSPDRGFWERHDMLWEFKEGYLKHRVVPRDKGNKKPVTTYEHENMTEQRRKRNLERVRELIYKLTEGKLKA